MTDFDPIRIVGIIEEQVSRPRNDGTSGSALYRVPFKLSRRPPAEWAEYFPNAWNNPPSFTTSHRPGICSVEGDTIWLNRTTLEEVERAHKKTLLLALDETNQKYVELLAQREAAEQRLVKERDAHKQHVSEAVKKINFD